MKIYQGYSYLEDLPPVGELVIVHFPQWPGPNRRDITRKWEKLGPDQHLRAITVFARIQEASDATELHFINHFLFEDDVYLSLSLWENIALQYELAAQKVPQWEKAVLLKSLILAQLPQ